MWPIPNALTSSCRETLGNYPFEENIVGTLNDARERFLVPGGIIIPHAVEQFVCPVTSRALLPRTGGLGRCGLRPRLRSRQGDDAEQHLCPHLRASDLLAEAAAAKSWDKLTFDRSNRPTRSGEAAWTARKRVTVYGLALWWSAELVTGVSLSTGPLDPRTHWEQLYLPVLTPILLEPGQTLSARLRSTTSYDAGTNITWTPRCHRRQGTRTAAPVAGPGKGLRRPEVSRGYAVPPRSRR